MKNFVILVGIIGIIFFTFKTYTSAYNIISTIEAKNTFVNVLNDEKANAKVNFDESNITFNKNLKYQVYVENLFKNSFETLDEAKDYSNNFNYASVKTKENSNWVYDNYPPFNVFVNNEQKYTEYETFSEAVSFAKNSKRAYIYYRKNNTLIWTNTSDIPKSKQITAQNIMQNPELPRGCEVTSCAMLLNYKGYAVSKIDLADKIKKDETGYSVKNGKIFFGNPNNGFVGDMFDVKKKGFGVYHKPILELLEQFSPYGSVDLTGCEFEDLQYFINNDLPIVVITNTTYNELEKSNFVPWQTPSGEIEITYLEHSVLVTGYDNDYIYFNDPLGRQEKANKNNFIKAWIQMGRQALSIT